MAGLTIFGYPARLILDLPGGEHDVSHCMEVLTTMRTHHAEQPGFWVNTDRLLSEIAVENRTRQRIKDATGT